MGEALPALRHLPRVDDIMAHPCMGQMIENTPRRLARRAAQAAVEEARAAILAGTGQPEVTPDSIAERAAEILGRLSLPSLRRAINAAGIILHTGLGRAPLSESAQQALADVAAGYSTVQTDAVSGQRTQREIHIQWLLQEITGAEAALVVNNNAAATTLVLHTFATGREVIVSRGEMIEIGGAFRIPDIMKLAGCRLVEVGCTNRTHLQDYENAITENTGLILAVHQSNYRIQGFAAQVEISELVKLAHAHNLPCAHDLGSGALLDLETLGLPHEPSVPESLAANADVTFFSGDKLIGGPQCGIILGKTKHIQTMRRNPFYRTFRVCKLTLAALEGTLRLFLDQARLTEQHRLMAILTYPLDKIRGQANTLAEQIREACAAWLQTQVQEGESAVGGGSLAGQPLPTAVVRLTARHLPIAELAKQLRLSAPPIFTRIHEDSILLDPRTLLAGEEEFILRALERIGRSVTT